MTAAGAAIFVAVIALALWAILAPPRARAWLGRSTIVIWGGLVFPIVTLTALLVFGLALARDLVRAPSEAPLRIAIVGEQWWWRVRYLDEDGSALATSANEVRIPTGRPVEFELTTADVIHSFWVPSLGGKLDMIPGRTNRIVLEADRPGIYRGQCAEFCGGQHALMAFEIVALEPEEFRAWLEKESAPAAEPGSEAPVRGRDIFMQFGCGACHAIDGTEAVGSIGPDLTHVAGRRTIAAGTLPNDPASLAAWIADSQAIKPGNLMPPFRMLSPDELDALVSYLGSLR